jgi:acetyl-CoA carboxylase carboxyl transferase subunit beta
MKNIFKKTKYVQVPLKHLKDKEPSVPTGSWIKCEVCGEALYKEDIIKNDNVCKNCKNHFRMNARDRINSIIDIDTFNEINSELKTKNVLNFEGYDKKIENLQLKTGLEEAVITGIGEIDSQKVAVGVMDSRFLMGSMGAVVGEKLTLLIEHATANKLPVIIFTASGGARMQEGMISLMQMAKTSAALAKHSENNLLYITVLTDPTTGGVTASFAMLGDIILAEPGSLIGFAGPRVIKQTINQELPEGFQTAEFLLEHGFVDKIVNRNDMKDILSKLLRLNS